MNHKYDQNARGTMFIRRAELSSAPVVCWLLLSGWMLALLPGGVSHAQTRQDAAAGELPTEIPQKFVPPRDDFNYVERTAMIPMRDGVKLHTVILVPKGATNAPILLTRTPYDAKRLSSHTESTHLGPKLNGYDNAPDLIVEGGYIRVVQDVRGKHGSEGEYVVARPLRGPLNQTKVDHATDTYDTIDWLVKNVPESNGRVGVLGISYNGFLTLMSLVDPHPAMKVAVPMNPMVDGWIGDDWYHNGAFRQQMMPWIFNQVATRKGDERWWTSHYDDYDTFMQAVSAGEAGRRRGMEQLGFWRKLIAHPAYDSFWQDQAVDRELSARPLAVPVMIVHSLWDQEDIYGAIAVYEALEPKDKNNDRVYLVMGPWCHGQSIGQGDSLGALNFGSDTALYFRRRILRPFLDQYLKEDAPKANVPPVAAFETGTNTWRRLDAWPAARNGSIQSKPLYVRAGLKLSFEAPKPDEPAFEEYISDPSKPVPYRSRPIPSIGAARSSWRQWLVDDQRQASGRPDVVAVVSEVLTEPLTIAGQPVANLVASTSGTDADWVVKLIDVYPDEVATEPAMGGYQLMVAADIFRGRYHESREHPRPLPSGKPVKYRFNLPTSHHTFLPGHRIMVQVQSSWFPLYDRNPQTFVENIFWAKLADFRKATQRVYHSPEQSSFVELPVVKRGNTP
jgi:putative CocE/NonD family hydrolase